MPFSVCKVVFASSSFHLYLVITLVRVEETFEQKTFKRLDILIDHRERVTILRVGVVKIWIINAHSPRTINFLYHDKICYPHWEHDLPEDVNIHQVSHICIYSPVPVCCMPPSFFVWQGCSLVFAAKVVADPWRLLNLTKPWIVNWMRCSGEIIDRPNRMLCSAGYRVKENLIVLVIRSLSSWLTIIKGNWIVPNGYKLCVVNLINVPPGWRL